MVTLKREGKLDSVLNVIGEILFVIEIDEATLTMENKIAI